MQAAEANRRDYSAGDKSYDVQGVAPTKRARQADIVTSCSLQALTVLLWCWAWVPQMVDLINIGPQYPALGETAKRSAAAGSAYIAVVAAIAGVSLFVLFWNVISGRGVYGMALLLPLLPWVALNGYYTARGGSNNEVILFPLVAAAFAIGSRSLDDVYRILRVLVIMTAVMSLYLGFADPGKFLTDATRQLGNEKAIIGTRLLNGLMPTSNQLGIALALGLPVLIITGRSRKRWLAVPPVLYAMVWAASRTSLAVTLLVLSVMYATPRGGRRQRSLVRTAIVVCGIVVVAVPLLIQTPDSFARRGEIWQASFRQLLAGMLTPIFGTGPMIYRTISPITLDVGAITGTGHNVFVTVLTVGGVAGVLSTATLCRFYFVRATELWGADRLPLIFMLALSSVAILEDPMRAFVITPASFLIIPLLIMPLAGTRPARRRSRRDVRTMFVEAGSSDLSLNPRASSSSDAMNAKERS